MSIKAWSDEDEQKLIDTYINKTTDVHEIAELFSKGHRSVISKLVQLKIYKKPDNSDEQKSRTVKMMLRDLEQMLAIRIEGTNLNKKSNLLILVEAVEKALKEM